MSLLDKAKELALNVTEKANELGSAAVQNASHVASKHSNTSRASTTPRLKGRGMANTRSAQLDIVGIMTSPIF